MWLRASTARSYAAHMRGYLVPYLGGIPLAALTAGDVQAMFTAIARDETALGGRWARRRCTGSTRRCGRRSTARSAPG